MTRRLAIGRRQCAHCNGAGRLGDAPDSCTHCSGSGYYERKSPWQKVKAGDRLWVRENLCQRQGISILGEPMNVVEARYEADEAEVLNEHGFNLLPWWKTSGSLPCIHMPRYASRLTLIITNTKVEPLQSISLQDVRAEGCEVREFWLFGADGPERQKIGANVFGTLWSELHGRENWNANPDVVALTFRVVKANIDSREAAR